MATSTTFYSKTAADNLLAGKADLDSGKLRASQLPLGTTSTTALAGNTTADQIGGATAAQGTLAQNAVPKGTLIVSALDNGAVGNGSTDDAAAINAVISTVSTRGGGTVFLPFTTAGYAVSGIVLKTGVTLAGAFGVKVKRTGAASVVMVNATNVSDVAIEDVTLDSAGLSTAATVRASTGATRMAVRRVTFLDSAQPAGVYALDTQACVGLTVDECRFVNMANNVRLNLGAQDVTINRCRFTGWKERCIYVLGSSTYSCTDVTLTHNRFTDMAAGGSVRQPVAFQGNDAMPHQRVTLFGNRAVGTGTAVNDATTPGTADLLSLQHVVDFAVIGNYAIGSGDVGITIAEQCTHGVVTGNNVRGANSCGIAIGAGTTTDVGHLTVSGNTLMNNGLDTQGDRTANRGGIWMRNAHNVVTGQNILGDDQTVKTQQYGYILLDCDGVTIGVDKDAGLAAGMLDTSGGNVTNLITTHQSVLAGTATSQTVVVANGAAAPAGLPDGTVITDEAVGVRGVIIGGVEAAVVTGYNQLTAGSTITVQSTTVWPARPTARTDVFVVWEDSGGLGTTPAGAINGDRVVT